MINGKLTFVAAQHGEANLDLLLYARDFLDAVRQWKKHYNGWDWPEKVKIFTMPGQRDAVGVIDWTTLHHIEINPQDVV